MPIIILECTPSPLPHDSLNHQGAWFELWGCAPERNPGYKRNQAGFFRHSLLGDTTAEICKYKSSTLPEQTFLPSPTYLQPCLNNNFSTISHLSSTRLNKLFYHLPLIFTPPEQQLFYHLPLPIFSPLTLKSSSVQIFPFER